MKNPQKPTRRSLEQLVSLRLTVEDALFIANELKSCASVGAEDPAYLRIPDQIQRQLAKHERKQANSEISAMTTGCYHDRPCPGPIARAVEDCGFDVAALDRRYEPESQGQASFEIGRGVWLCISWYKLPITGRFEIVAYAS